MRKTILNCDYESHLELAHNRNGYRNQNTTQTPFKRP